VSIVVGNGIQSATFNTGFGAASTQHDPSTTHNYGAHEFIVDELGDYLVDELGNYIVSRDYSWFGGGLATTTYTPGDMI
jgi:hypothetical protein